MEKDGELQDSGDRPVRSSAVASGDRLLPPISQQSRMSHSSSELDDQSLAAFLDPVVTPHDYTSISHSLGGSGIAAFDAQEIGAGSPGGSGTRSSNSSNSSSKSIGQLASGASLKRKSSHPLSNSVTSDVLDDRIPLQPIQYAEVGVASSPTMQHSRRSSGGNVSSGSNSAALRQLTAPGGFPAVSPEMSEEDSAPDSDSIHTPDSPDIGRRIGGSRGGSPSAGDRRASIDPATLSTTRSTSDISWGPRRVSSSGDDFVPFGYRGSGPIALSAAHSSSSNNSKSSASLVFERRRLSGVGSTSANLKKGFMDHVFEEGEAQPAPTFHLSFGSDSASVPRVAGPAQSIDSTADLHLSTESGVGRNLLIRRSRSRTFQSSDKLRPVTSPMEGSAHFSASETTASAPQEGGGSSSIKIRRGRSFVDLTEYSMELGLHSSSPDAGYNPSTIKKIMDEAKAMDDAPGSPTSQAPQKRALSDGDLSESLKSFTDLRQKLQVAMDVCRVELANILCGIAEDVEYFSSGEARSMNRLGSASKAEKVEDVTEADETFAVELTEEIQRIIDLDILTLMSPGVCVSIVVHLQSIYYRISDILELNWLRQHITGTLLAFSRIARLVEHLQLDGKGLNQFVTFQRYQQTKPKSKRAPTSRKTSIGDSSRGPNQPFISWGFSQPDIKKSSVNDASLDNTANTLMMELDSSGIIRYVSPSVIQFFGYDATSVTGTDGSLFLHPEDKAIFSNAGRSIAQGKSRSMDIGFRAVKPDNTVLNIEARGLAILDKSKTSLLYSMWICRVLNSSVDNLGDDTDFEDSGDNQISSDPPVVCRICEKNIPAPRFEEHSDLCSALHRAEADAHLCHDELIEWKNAIVVKIDEISLSLDETDSESVRKTCNYFEELKSVTDKAIELAIPDDIRSGNSDTDLSKSPLITFLQTWRRPAEVPGDIVIPVGVALESLIAEKVANVLKILKIAPILKETETKLDFSDSFSRSRNFRSRPSLRIDTNRMDDKNLGFRLDVETIDSPSTTASHQFLSDSPRRRLELRSMNNPERALSPASLS
eukprot:Partr_v1_DN28997_c0_g1_i1_m25561